MHKRKCVTNWDIDHYKLSFIQKLNVVGEMYVVWYNIISPHMVLSMKMAKYNLYKSDQIISMK